MPLRPGLFALSSLAVASAAILPGLAVGETPLPTVEFAPIDMGACYSVTPGNYRGTRAVIACTCPAGASTSGSVWGTDTYTDDSAICTAALHRGLIGEDGGRVALQIMPGQSGYRGSTRNGIGSSPFGAWSGSYRFVGLDSGGGVVTSGLASISADEAGACDSAAAWRGRAATLTCSCPANFPSGRAVWGTDTYTDDSYICRAAQHAGKIDRAKGGKVTIELLPGRSSYTGSSRNGVSTSDFGSWGGSYRFAR